MNSKAQKPTSAPPASPTREGASPSQEEYIGHYHHAPSFMKDNVDITHGYRINFNTPKKIIKSLFMVHNESVNVWTHLVPALFLICLIVYLLLFVGPSSIMQEFSKSKESLSAGIESYSSALNQMSVVIKMKEFSVFTEREFNELTQNVISQYNEFSSSVEEWKKKVDENVLTMQDSFKSSLLHQISELEELKIKFEEKFVPSILNSFKGQIDHLDSDYIKRLQLKLDDLKHKIDSETFRYIESPLYNTPNPHEISRWPIFAFISSAIFTLTCSSLFHLFYPMSGKAYKTFSRLDYAGVNILIAGSLLPAAYYGLYCKFEVAIFYIVSAFIIGGTLFVFTLFDFLHRPENLVIKSLAYGGFGVSLVIPIIHMLLNEFVYGNYGDPFSFALSVPDYALVGFCYLMGLYVYTVRCPERFHPGKYNVCGHSHQIWHIFVVLGVVFTYSGVLKNFEMRKISMCPMPPLAI